MSDRSSLPAFLEEFIQLQVKHGVLVCSDQLGFFTTDLFGEGNATFDQRVDEESVRTYVTSHLDQDLKDAMAPVRGKCLPVLTTESTEEMQDSVRQMLIHMQTPGITFGQIRHLVELAGVSTAHWPDWTKNRDQEHFNKAARAGLLWHCMAHAALNGFSDD